MSERVILDRVVVSEWIERAFREGSGSPESYTVTLSARYWWDSHRDQIMRELEEHSLVLPRSLNSGD